MSEALPSRDAAPSDWIFGPKATPIVVRNADMLMAELALFLGGWPMAWAGRGGDGAPDIEILRDGAGGFTIIRRGPGAVTQGFDNALDAANGLAGALISAYVTADPELICLHGAAAEIDQRLVVFVGDSLSGKSSLALHLAMAGLRFFGDDRIAIRRAEGTRAAVGICLGLAPKCRLPIPEDAGARFARFIEAMSAVQTDSTAYLKLTDREAAAFGQSAPLGAIVVLDRSEGAPPALAPLAPPELARAVFAHGFAPHLSSAELLAGATALAQSTQVHRLTFGSSAAAARIVRESFGAAPIVPAAGIAPR